MKVSCFGAPILGAAQINMVFNGCLTVPKKLIENLRSSFLKTWVLDPELK